MFDLERRMQEWKAGFASTEALRKTDVEELEQHVRDALPSLLSAGLSAEEAFIIATRRVGAPAAIAREFAKVSGTHVWSQRVFWIVAGALGYVVCRLAIGAAASVTQAMIGLSGGSITAMAYAGVAVTCLAWIAVAAALFRRRDTTAEPWTRRRAGAVAAGVLLALVVAGLMNLAGEVVLLQLLPFSNGLPAALMTSFAARTAAVLVPLVMFAAVVLVRLREHASAEN